VRVEVATKAKPAQSKGKKGQSKRKKQPAKANFMSECARKYLSAITRPFSSEAEGACLPYPPDRNSQKVTALTRFNLTAEGSGDAWVMIAPCLASDYIAIWTNAGSVTIPFTVAALNTAPANYTGYTFATLPYSGSDLATPGLVDGRVVSVGIRMTYTGSVSAMAGTYFAYSEPGHGNVNCTGLSFSSGLFTATETSVRRVTDQKFEIGWTVVNDNEHSYVGGSSFLKNTSTGNNLALYPWSNEIDVNGKGVNTAGYLLNGAPSLIAGVAGGTSAGKYYVEVIQHVEYVGKKASVGLTPSHNDHNAANVITAAADRAAGEFSARPEESWSKCVSRVLRNVVSEHASQGTKMAFGFATRVAAARVGRRRGQLALN